MMWAKCNQIPVITLAPKGSHYHKSETTLLDVPIKDWIHPFVESLSDKVVGSLEEASFWIERFVIDPSLKVKDRTFIEEAMHYYQKTQLAQDIPMKNLLPKLKKTLSTGL